MKFRTKVLCSASLLATLIAAPALAQTAQTGPSTDTGAPVEESTATEVDEVVVTGLRRSLASAQAIKRNSDQIVDAIVAEDIGKLPDVTASDSLARVTGVQVQRGGGEAGQVLVRGLPDITTSYNGRDIFTAEARFVAVQDFPAGGVSALEVYKSTTADQVEGGIAGLINVRSRRPFDFADREIAGGIRYTYANQSGEYDPNGNLLISDRWDTGMGEFGALLNVSYTRLRYLDSVRFNGGFIATGGNGIPAGGRFPDAVGIFQGEGDRERPSVNAALQWRPNASLELYADFLYQGFHNQVSDRQLFVPLFGATTFSNVVLQPGSNEVQSLTANGQVRPEMFQGATENQTDTYQYAIGGVWREGPWKVSADLARTTSKYDSSIYSLDSAFTFAPTLNVNFDVGGDEGGVDFDFVGFDMRDPDNYRYRGFFDRHLVAEGEDVQFRTDVEYETGIDFITKLQFGFRYVDRDGSFRNGERYSYQEPLGLLLSDLPVNLVLSPRGFEGGDIKPADVWVTATYGSIRGNIADLRALAGFAPGAPAFDQFSAFDANEKSYAGYAQLRYSFPDLLLPIDGVLGLRAVKTEISVAGTNRLVGGGPDVFQPIEDESSYVDYLPSAAARIRFTEQTQLRLAVNQTRTRPNFNQLNPALNIPNSPGGSGFIEAYGGNVDLEPIESTNYDVSLEHYFATTGFASFALFQRDVDGFIVGQRRLVNYPGIGTILVDQPVNLNETRLQGVEAQLTTFFDFEMVPEWARSFGIQLNYTYIDGDLPGISEHSYNIVGMYERGPFSARLAYNNRTEWLNGPCEGGTGNPGCEYTEDVSRLDFSANYSPLENITLTFDVSNILGEPLQTYRAYETGLGGTFPRDVRFEETIYSLGLRFRY